MAKKITDKEATALGAECLVHFKDTMIGAGATSKQMIEVVQSIALAVTIEGVGTGPGSRSLLTGILTEMHRTYLKTWEDEVEADK